MKSTVIPVFIFVIHFWNEKDVVKENVIGVFEKNAKACLQNKKSVSDAAFKASLFSSDFNFACKDGRGTAATWKY